MADPQSVARIEALIPLGEMAEADDIGLGIAFLAGDAARMVTGQTLVVDGGYLAQ